MNQASQPYYLSFLHYSSFLVIQVICILLSITLTFHRYLKFVYLQSRGEQFRPYTSSDIPVYAPPLLILVFPFSFSSDFIVILLFQHYIHPSADCLREGAIPSDMLCLSLLQDARIKIVVKYESVFLMFLYSQEDKHHPFRLHKVPRVI